MRDERKCQDVCLIVCLSDPIFLFSSSANNKQRADRKRSSAEAARGWTDRQREGQSVTHRPLQTDRQADGQRGDKPTAERRANKGQEKASAVLLSSCPLFRTRTRKRTRRHRRWRGHHPRRWSFKETENGEPKQTKRPPPFVFVLALPLRDEQQTLFQTRWHDPTDRRPIALGLAQEIPFKELQHGGDVGKDNIEKLWIKLCDERPNDTRSGGRRCESSRAARTRQGATPCLFNQRGPFHAHKGRRGAEKVPHKQVECGLQVTQV